MVNANLWPRRKKATAKFRNRGLAAIWTGWPWRTAMHSTLPPQGCAPGMIASGDILNATFWQEENIIMARGHHSSGQHNYELAQSSRYSTTYLYCRKRKRKNKAVYIMMTWCFVWSEEVELLNCPLTGLIIKIPRQCNGSYNTIQLFVTIGYTKQGKRCLFFTQMERVCPASCW